MLSVIIVTSVLAAEPAPPPPPPTVSAPLTYPTWSLGAGLFFASEGSLGVGAALGGVLGGVSVPTVSPSVSLERAFTSHFAVGLGAQGTFTTTQSGMAETPSGSLGVGVSPRFVLTAPEAPVSFTFFTTVMIGYAAATSNVNLTGMLGQVSVLSGSVAGGGALELKLLERLAVRVQASFVRFSVSRLGVKASMNATESTATTTGVSFIPSPGLELRLYL